MPFSAEIIGIIIAALSAFIAGSWILYRFIRGLDKKAATNEKAVADQQLAARLKSIEHDQKDVKDASEKAIKDVKDAHEKALENLGDKVQLEQEKLMIRVDYLEKEVDCIASKQASDYAKHDEIIDDIREVLSDIRETIAGFGKDFVTRREFLDSKRRDKDA